MFRRNLTILLLFIILALIVGLIGWMTDSINIKWSTPAVTLSLLAVGLSLNSLMIVRHTDKSLNEANIILTRILNLQEEMQKEQKERADSNSTIAPTLQALTQYYSDYLIKQKDGEE
ncbi:hypothetical protein ACFLTP_01695 [Chloroflexota bacterium]